MKHKTIKFSQIKENPKLSLSPKDYLENPKPFEKEIDPNKPINEQVEIGLGCTGGAGSDRYPYTIVKIENNGKTIWVTSDRHTPAEGYDYYANQVHEFETNWNTDHAECYTLRKNGRYIAKGRALKEYWCSVGIGYRRYYQDPHF